MCRRIRETQRPARADADGARRRPRQDRRSRGRGRRLPHEAVQSARARGARAGDPPPQRRRRRSPASGVLAARRPRARRGAARMPCRRAGDPARARRSSTCSGSCSTTRGLVLTRDQLLERVWGYTFAGDTRTVDVHVRQLRRKLGDASPIVTVWGIGYKAAPAPRRRRVGRRRARLTALPAAGAVPASASCSPRVVATLIAVRFFQSYTRAARLRSCGPVGRDRAAVRAAGGRGNVSVASLEAAIGGDKTIFWVPAVPGGSPARRSAAGAPESCSARGGAGGREAARRSISTCTAARYLGVAQEVTLGSSRRCGALVVAKPESAAAQPLAAAVLASWRSRSGSGSPSPGLVGDLLLAPDRAAARMLADRGRRGRGRPLRRRGAGAHVGQTRSSGSPRASTRWPAKLAESEQLSRNFLMSVSHELRTPLTAIRGHVSALQEGVIDDEACRQRSLEVVAEEAMRLERLVGDVLDLAKLDARRFAVLAARRSTCEHLCERAYATFAEEAKTRGIEYDLALEVRASRCSITDGDRVLQIVTNLLSNALHWTPAGGRVELGLRYGRRRGERWRSPTPARGSRRRSEERIFRPFWSGDGRRHGPRPGDRARARARARRPARAAQRARPRQPLRARPTACGVQPA